jgi:anthranilate synthase component 1
VPITSQTLSSAGPIPAKVHLTARPAARTAAPAAILGALKARGERDLVLLESGGHSEQMLPTLRRSLLVTRSLLRLEVRGRDVEVSPLQSSGAGLIDALASKFPGATVAGGVLRCTFPDARAVPGMPDSEVLAMPSVFDAIRAAAGLIVDSGQRAPFAPGLFGVLGYEIVDLFEEIGSRKVDPLDEPDASLVLGGDMVLFDHEAGTVHVITRGLPWEPASEVAARHETMVSLCGSAPAATALLAKVPPAPAETDMTDAEFIEAVRRTREHVGAGDIFQAVLSRGFRIKSDAPSVDVYRTLSARNPSPYMFHVDLPDGELLGASPETFLKVENRAIEIRPIAGTVPRGFAPDGSIDADLDERLAFSMMLDPKEQAEHAMLVDLARNDVARVSEPGTTAIVQLFAVEKYSHVQHIVSRVRGRLRAGLDALHAYRAVANMGTLSGAPKVRAMQIIRELETASRGFYGGAVGYLLQDGTFDSCIAIRTLRRKGDSYHTRAGAGIVWGSVPEKEFTETEMKSKAVRAAVASAEKGAKTP